MRVLLASGLEGIGLGGVQTETRQLVAGLRTAGVAAGVLVNRLPDDVAHGVEHFPIDYPPAPATTGPAVAAAVAAFRPDVVHVIGGGLSFVRTAERAAAGVPCAVTVHNVPPAEQVGRFLYGWNGGHYLLRNARSLASAASWQWYLRAASRFAKAVCHSELVYRRVVAAVRDPGRVALIRLSGHQDLADAAAPAADAPAQYPSPFPLDAHPKLLTVGGIVHHKGLHDGIRAVRQLAGEFPRIHYHIIGQTRDGRYRNYVKRLVAAADVAGHVTLTLSGSDALKAAALRAADVFVQPSHEEGFCLSFLEAASIVPRLVGTATGDIPGMVIGPGMRLVVPRSAEALTAGIRAALADTVPPTAVAARRATLDERYSWDQYVRQHLDLYAQLAAAPRT